MQQVLRTDRGIWVAALAGALAVMAMVPVLFRSPTPRLLQAEGGLRPGRTSSVGFRPVNPSDTNVNLLDPTPLFLPTAWNARPDALPADAVREPGSTFGNYTPSLIFHEDSANLAFPVIVAVPEKPVGALDIGAPHAAFTGMGRTDRAVAPLAARDAFISISAEGTGTMIIEESVVGARPPGEMSWQPLEFLAVVQASGLVSPPTLVGAGSGFEPVDVFFQNYLAKGMRIGERLAPGFYRIKIGP